MKQIICSIILLLGVISYAGFASNTRVTTVSGFNTALSSVVAGDTITLANQTWQNVLIEFSGKNGTASLPIVLCAETFGSVIITGNSNLRIGGNYLKVEGLFFKNAVSSKNHLVEYRSSSGTYANHSRLTKSAFLNCNPASSTTSYIWVNMYGTYNRMDHCYLSGKNHDGPMFQVTRDVPDANYAQIDLNYFANRPNLGVNGQETVKIGSGPLSLFNSNSVVEFNLFEKCNGEVETISNKSCENIIRYNTFLNNEGTVCLRQGRRCQIYGNFFLGNGTSNTGGIRVHGNDHRIYNNYFSGLRGKDVRSALSIENGHEVTDTTTEAQYFPVRRLLVAFNTFVSNANNINVGIDGDGLSIVPPDSVTFVNNVIKGENGITQSPLFTQIDTATHTMWSANIFYGTSLGIFPVPPGFANIDPLLSLQADGLFRPAANSPLINSAQGSYSFVAIDMDGQLRDGLPDIGADEVSSAPVTIKPVTLSDVGPGSLQVLFASESERNDITPKNFTLDQNYPNPFNPTTKFGFRIPARPAGGSNFEFVKLSVYDLIGREIAVLVNEKKNPGSYFVLWNAARYPSGVYFCRMSVVPSAQPASPNTERGERDLVPTEGRNGHVNNNTESRKIILLK